MSEPKTYTTSDASDAGRRTSSAGSAGPGMAAVNLSQAEQIALELIAAGHSHVAAGKAIDRSAKTIQRLLQRPEAQAFVVAAQAARLDEVVGLLGMAAVEAAQVVREELHGESASTRLRAASLVLATFDQLRTAARRDTAIADLNEKLSQIEDELAEDDPGA